MKTIELSEEKARTLAEFLAGQWAEMAMRLVAVNAPGNTPYRNFGETMDNRNFKARVARKKRQCAAVGAVLEGLGINLPEPERAALVGPYKSPRPRSKTIDLWKGGSAVERERVRLVAIIKEQIK